MFGEKSVKIPEDLIKVGKIFKDHGFQSYLVGGAVRDMLMGKKAHDWDIATDAKPEEVMGIFRKVIPTGIAHGTVTIHIFGHEIETTTFRTDGSYTDGRHPDSISFTKKIEDDLSRRDFTMNAIAADLLTGNLTDPFNGQEDIKNKIIRTVGSPFERFNEDGLRPVRAIRFASQLHFTIEENTLNALSGKEVLKKTASISPERFRDEFCKLLSTQEPSSGLKLLEKSGILHLFIPEFDPCRNCIQSDSRGFHEFDVADHLFYAADGAPQENLIVRLAAFYHDIGKPEARSTEMLMGEEVIHFHGHEKISAEKCRASMTKLKFSNEEIKKTEHLVKHHMFYYESVWSDAAVRRFVIKVGKENIDDLIKLRLADIYGMHRTRVEASSASWQLLCELTDRIEKLSEQNTAFSLKDLKVNGNDLMQEGIPKGKVIGAILSELFETVTDSPEMNAREKLLPLAKNIYETKYKNV